MKWLWVLVLVVPSYAQERETITPENAVLAAYTSRWMVWNTTKPIPGAFSRSSAQNSFYLARVGASQASLVFRDTIGMIQSFNPIWIWDNGTVIGWDGYFSILKDNIVHPIEIESLAVNSLYLTPLLLAMPEGVVLIANNDHASTEVTEPAFFVPWSFSDGLLRVDQCTRITDSTGLMFYDAQIRYADGHLLALRAPTGFLFNVSGRSTTAIHFPEMSIGERLTGFDGQSLVTRQNSQVYFYDIDGQRITSAEVTDDAVVLAYRKHHLYTIQGHALTKSDTLVHELQAFSVKAGRWINLRTVHPVEWLQSDQPTWMIQSDYLWLWTGGRWRKFNWLD